MPPRPLQSQIPTAEQLRALRDAGVREFRCGDMAMTFWPLSGTAEAVEVQPAAAPAPAPAPAPPAPTIPREVRADAPAEAGPADALEWSVNDRHPNVAPFELAEGGPS